MFGVEGSEDVPISTAVRASGALPMVYAPVRVKDRELIDGGMVSTTNLDIAVEAGREADRRDQPDRAVRQRLRRAGAHAARHAAAPCLGHGLPADRLSGVQARRAPAPARTCQELGAALPGRRHRADRARTDRRTDVPDLDDELHLARGDRAPWLRVGDQAPRGASTSATRSRRSHGIDISAKRVRKVVEHFDDEPEQVSAWRKILEGTTGTLLRQSGSAS